MEINGKNKKELKAIFRTKVAGGKYASRTTLLAYAFVRGLQYKTLESIINEDHESFGIEGRNSFLRSLAFQVANAICESVYDSVSNEQYKEYNKVRNGLAKVVFNWMLSKYEASSEEEAA